MGSTTDPVSGRGKWMGSSAGPLLDRLIGGWQVQGLTRWSSGAPFNITSGRNTTGALVGQNAVLRNMTASELQKQIGVFRGGNGVYWLNPNSGLFTITGTSSRAVMCTAGQTTPCFDHPGVAEMGNLPYFGLDAPRFFNQDLSMLKRIPIRERLNFEIRFEFFNAFNNPNFGGLTTGIDSSSFGSLTNTVDTVRGGGVTSRLIQWAARLNW